MVLYVAQYTSILKRISSRMSSSYRANPFHALDTIALLKVPIQRPSYPRRVPPSIGAYRVADEGGDAARAAPTREGYECMLTFGRTPVSEVRVRARAYRGGAWA